MNDEARPSSSDFVQWRAELLRCGRIVQDDDVVTPRSLAERDFDRYVALVDGVIGNESAEVAAALIESCQAEEDYGAYQATQTATFRFPPEVFAQALVQQLPNLISKQPNWAGQFLNALTNSYPAARRRIIAFNAEVDRSSEVAQKIIKEFVRQQEQNGWLRGRRRNLLCTPRWLNERPVFWYATRLIKHCIRSIFTQS